MEYNNIDIDDQVKKAEIAKLKAEARALRRPLALNPATWASLFIGIGGFLTAMTQWSSSDLKVQRASFELEQKVEELEQKAEELDNMRVEQVSLARENVRLEREVEGRQGLLDDLQGQITMAEELLERLKNEGAEQGFEASEELASQITENSAQIEQTLEQFRNINSQIYIHFRGSLQRQLINQLRAFLEEISIENRSLITPEAERLSGSYGSSVRFFYESDEITANAVKTAVMNFLNNNNCPISNIDLIHLPELQSSVPEGQIEVWIHHNCS